MSRTDVRTLADLGEFGLIAEIIGALPRASPAVRLGPGDDAAVVALTDPRCVVSTDILVEGVHFKGEWSSATEIGHRAAAASLADIVSMGAAPVAVVVALTGPAEMNAQWVLDAAAGVAAECAIAGASLVGGDISRARHVSLCVTAVGDLGGRAPVTRAGAQPGDLVAIAGRQGWAAAGLTVLSRGFRSPRVLVEAYRYPEPPYAAGPAAADAGATAMIDVSDGLLADLGHIARASDVLVDLDPARLPVAEELRATSAAFNVDPLLWYLSGGDDHALVATFPVDAPIPAAFRIIGLVSARGDAPGVTVGGQAWPGPTGHEHFKA